MKTRARDFYDRKRRKAFYSLQVWVYGFGWVYIANNLGPIGFRKEADRDAYRKQVSRCRDTSQLKFLTEGDIP